MSYRSYSRVVGFHVDACSPGEANAKGKVEAKVRLVRLRVNPRWRRYDALEERYSPKLKFQVVLEVLTGEKTPGQVAKAYGIHANTIRTCERQLRDRGAEIFAEDSTVKEYEWQLADLERLLGKKEVEIAALKDFLGRSA